MLLFNQGKKRMTFIGGGSSKTSSHWKPAHRRQRHITSQMKYFGSPKFKADSLQAWWKFANKQSKKYGKNGLFGIS